MTEAITSKRTNGATKEENEPGLLSKLLGSSAWVFGGYAFSQLIRLGGNLILTRLLLPEAFGLMALITVAIMGVSAFTDIGLRGSIVQNDRGDEELFLNTAWTVQILRATIVWLVLCALAKPAADFYEAPQLVYLIPIVCFNAVISGCASTAVFTLVRQISLKRKVLLDIAGKVVGLTIMVVSAWIWKSVWALVAGSIFAALFKTVTSHFLIPDYKNRLAFDKEAFWEIFHFGKWVFLATALTFLGGQGDRLVLGKVFSSSELGVYSIAFFLSQAIVLACHQLSMNVLFPVYTKLAKRRAGELRKQLVKIRGGLLVLTLPLLCTFAIWGQPIVSFFYSERYVEAGWMLEILAVRSIAQTVIFTSERVLLAFGDSFRHMILQLCRALFLMVGMYYGFQVMGVQGLLVGMCVASFVEYLALAWLIHKYDAWLPKVDFLAFAVTGGVIALGKYLL